MYQRVVIVGNLGRDPEVRYLPNGNPVANFPVATHRRWTDNEGNNHEETTWFRVSVFGRTAEVCNQYLEKGRLVLCDGEIKTGQYEDQGGVTRYTWELRANTVKFLSGSGERAPMPFDGQEPAVIGGQVMAAPAGAGNSAGAGNLAEDDIPF